MMAWVSGRFSQFVPSRSMRYGIASSRKPSTPMSSQNRITLSISASTARVVEVQVGLVVEEAVPVVAFATGSHVQFDFSVSVKMMRASVYFWSVSLQT